MDCALPKCLQAHASPEILVTIGCMHTLSNHHHHHHHHHQHHHHQQQQQHLLPPDSSSIWLFRPYRSALRSWKSGDSRSGGFDLRTHGPRKESRKKIEFLPIASMWLVYVPTWLIFRVNVAVNIPYMDAMGSFVAESSDIFQLLLFGSVMASVFMLLRCRFPVPVIL